MNIKDNLFSVVIVGHLVDCYRSDGTSYQSRSTTLAGLFKEKEEAISIIVNNVCDLAEDGYYPYALVEQVNYGLYGIGAASPLHVWYRWDSVAEKYLEIDKRPDDLAVIVQFTLM